MPALENNITILEIMSRTGITYYKVNGQQFDDHESLVEALKRRVVNPESHKKQYSIPKKRLPSPPHSEESTH